MKLKYLGRFRDEGLLLLRLGLGGMFLLHGGPKLIGGPEKWEAVGRAVTYLGIDGGFAAWGFLAGLGEFAGGLALILGAWFRPACLLLTGIMAVAATSHFGRGEGLMGASHAVELGIVFCALALVGPGRFSLDRG